MFVLLPIIPLQCPAHPLLLIPKVSVFSDHVMSYLFKRKCRGGIPMFANVNAKIIKMVVSLFVRLWSLKCFL